MICKLKKKSIFKLLDWQTTQIDEKQISKKFSQMTFSLRHQNIWSCVCYLVKNYVVRTFIFEFCFYLEKTLSQKQEINRAAIASETLLQYDFCCKILKNSEWKTEDKNDLTFNLAFSTFCVDQHTCWSSCLNSYTKWCFDRTILGEEIFLEHWRIHKQVFSAILVSQSLIHSISVGSAPFNRLWVFFPFSDFNFSWPPFWF